MTMADNKLKCWMRIGQWLEDVLEDYPRVLDALEAGGVRGLVIGRMAFQRQEGEGSVAAFSPDPAIYQRLGVAPPEAPAEEQPEKRRLLEAMLTDAVGRGWPVWIFEAAWGRGSGEGHLMFSDEAQRAYAARVIDTLRAFPMATGAIMDGPEWGYEIDPGHRSYMFEPLSAEALEGLSGDEVGEIQAGQETVYERLHALASEEARHVIDGDPPGVFGWLFGGADAFAWWSFRHQSLTAFVQNVRRLLDEHGGKAIHLGMGPRTPAFGGLAGYDLRQLGATLDLILPKFYLHHRGYDGLYGTVGRYIRVLCEWNPELPESDVVDFVRGLTGLRLPAVSSLDDLDSGFPPAFFTEDIAAQATRVIAESSQDGSERPEQICPWVDSGRLPHAGDPVTAGDLRRILQAGEEAGLQQFLYHNHTHLTAAEWRVISKHCGVQWEPSSGGYRPPDKLHVMP